MSFCCENPIDLGCRSACAPITLPVAITETAYYTIVYEFSGALISREFEATPVNGFLQIPSYMFNETQNVTFQIYDALGVLVACFKAHILPSNSTLQPVEPPPLIAVNTIMSKYPILCSNGENRNQLVINHLSGFAGVQIGTCYNLDIQVTHGGNSHSYQLFYDINLTQPIIQNKYIHLYNGIPIFYIRIQLSNCNQKFEVTANVSSIENLLPGYYDGTHTPVIYTN